MSVSSSLLNESESPSVTGDSESFTMDHREMVRHYPAASGSAPENVTEFSSVAKPQLQKTSAVDTDDVTS